MDVMRDKVGKLASAGSFKPLKIVKLYEATHLHQASQVILLIMLETFSLTSRFILTGNYPERLIEPLRSRLQEFDLSPPSKKVVAQHISTILDKEEIEYEIPDLVTIVNKFYPDFRKIINNCQKYTVDGALRLDTMSNSTDEYKGALLAELKKQSSKSFNNIRQIIADSNVNDFEDMFRYLYDNVEKYAPLSVGEVVIYIEEYQYHSNFRIDKEINMMALISRILSLISNKKVI
jgi:DNA polymerase III delta prime subunit